MLFGLRVMLVVLNFVFGNRVSFGLFWDSWIMVLFVCISSVGGWLVLMKVSLLVCGLRWLRK